MSTSVWADDTPEGLYKRLWQEGVAHRADYELVFRNKEGVEVASSRTLFYGSSTHILVDDVWIDGKLRHEAGDKLSVPDTAESRKIVRETKQVDSVID